MIPLILAFAFALLAILVRRASLAWSIAAGAASMGLAAAASAVWQSVSPSTIVGAWTPGGGAMITGKYVYLFAGTSWLDTPWPGALVLAGLALLAWALRCARVAAETAPSRALTVALLLSIAAALAFGAVFRNRGLTRFVSGDWDNPGRLDWLATGAKAAGYLAIAAALTLCVVLIHAAWRRFARNERG